MYIFMFSIRILLLTYACLVFVFNGYSQSLGSDRDYSNIKNGDNLTSLTQTVDFLFYDCYAFLACDPFEDTDITQFYISYVEHEDNATPCEGDSVGTPYTTQVYPPPQDTSCVGWWTMASLTQGQLGNHVNITSDYGVLTQHFEEDTDFSFRLFVEYNNSGNFVQLGDMDCIQTPTPLCNHPPATLVLNDQSQASGRVVTLEENQASLDNLRVFPNPTSSELNIVWEGSEGRYDMVIYDTRGRRVASYSSIHKNETFRIATESWAQGLYYCRVQDENSSQVARFSVMR
jgi:hypothetical protein